MSKSFSEHIKAKVIKAYLVDAHSHRRIQEEILNIPAPSRGGGFVAMTILHDFGIFGKKKGALIPPNTIEEELFSATPAYKSALLLLQKYYPK